MVIVADDVALLDNNDNRSLIGARGIAGTVFVHKFSGAAAKSGKTLAEVTELARQVAQGMLHTLYKTGRSLTTTIRR